MRYPNSIIFQLFLSVLFAAPLFAEAAGAGTIYSSVRTTRFVGRVLIPRGARSGFPFPPELYKAANQVCLIR